MGESALSTGKRLSPMFTLAASSLASSTVTFAQNAYSVHPSLVYSSRTLSPQDISSGMLRRVPVNLNRQAEEATIGLIRDALARGINLKEVSEVYQARSLRK